MTREQMIDVLEDYCNGNICDSCEFCNDCEKGMVFFEIVDEKLKDYVSRIDGKNTDAESQNVCELVGEKMEQVKVLKKVTRMIYPNRMEEVIPIKEFVKNFLEKGYKVEILTHLASDDLDVVVYKEVEMKE